MADAGGGRDHADRLARRQRRGDVHRLVLGVADPQPVADGILQALPRQMDPGDEDLDDTASSGSWSPYESTGSQQ